MDILISCVDTRTARFEIIHSPLFKECAYWLDIGNMADGGQFVLGQPKNNRNRRTPHRLLTVAELFPEIVKTAPHTTVVGRLDQALAARKPNLRWTAGQEMTHA